MKTILLFIFCLSLAPALNGQTEQNSAHTVGKPSLSKAVQDAPPNLVIWFSGPEDQPLKGHLELIINDEWYVPMMDAPGTYKTCLNPGKYTLKFPAPFCYEAVTDTVIVIKNEAVHITVRFRTKACILPEAKHGLCRVGNSLHQC